MEKKEGSSLGVSKWLRRRTREAIVGEEPEVEVMDLILA